MQVKTNFRAAGILVALMGMAIAQCRGAEAGALRVGTAKVDITPAKIDGLTNLWGHPLTGVHDKIYARAIVVDNGQTKAAIVAVDTVEITDGAPFVESIARETGIPATNIILAATHDHNAPMLGLRNADGLRKSGPAGTAYVTAVQGEMVATVKQAEAHMQAARVGVAQGAADININRDEPTPDGFIMGRNPEGASDKTVWVAKFESMSGEPLALLINYAVHADVIGVKNSLLTGDLPGATSRFVEKHYDNKVVALWTSSAAGDQNPIVMNPDANQPKPGDASAGNIDGSPENFAALDGLGRILGEEVVYVADGMKANLAQARIWGAEKVVSCPGQKVIGEGTGAPMRDVKVVDADPVSFHLGVLMIDKYAFTWASIEVVTKIYQRLRQESPYADTIMVTLANGRIGYIPDDASYDKWTQEAIGSPLKKGCGESAIVNGLVELMRQYEKETGVSEGAAHPPMKP